MILMLSSKDASMKQEDFEEYRHEFYDSSESYEETIDEIRQAKETGSRSVTDAKAKYMPTPAEIRQRLQDTQWLYAQGFPTMFVVSVMHHDMPTLDRVQRAVASGRTAKDIVKQFKPFLIRTRF